MRTKSFREAINLFQKYLRNPSEVARDIANDQIDQIGYTNARMIKFEMLRLGYKVKRWFFLGGVLAGKDFEKCGINKSSKLNHSRPIYNFRRSC